MNLNRKGLHWKTVPYLRIGGTQQYEFHLQMYEPLADWDVYDVWERERVRHMRKNLEKGEILFDIGAETGWLSVIYGQIVHPMNMVLIEPTKEFWPNIETLWHKNFDCEPLACYSGLFSERTTSTQVLDFHEWPEESKGDLIDKLSYSNIHDNTKQIPEIKLDDYVNQTGIVPNALTIDTEGSELLILRGAVETLANRNLKVWVSIHDDLAEKDYGVKPGAVQEFMTEQGYRGEYLGTDHEAHWYFSRGNK